ncbi:MAG: MFS transporter, partial [Hyphomicrobiales bacterium]
MSAPALKPSLLMLIAMSAIGPVALNIFIPSMPGLAAAFETDFKTAQLTLTFFLVSLAVSQLVIGPVSDRIGRRPVFLAGMALFVAASLACAFADTIGQLIAGRIVQAAGGCTGLVLARAIIRD